MGGDNGDEGCRGCAVGHGRRLRELTNEREYRGDEAEEIGKRFGARQDAKVRSTAKRAENSSLGEPGHAAVVISGGERSWISAVVRLSTTTIGPPQTGQCQRSFGGEACWSACGCCAAPRE
jgi:hypothetical protein